MFKLVQNKGYKVGNMDSTVVLQNPKIISHVDDMRNVISNICKTSLDNVSIKATTNEKMGFIGREEGITAYAVVLLLKD